MSRDVGVGQLVEELEQRGDRLPFEIGAFVALEACEGLLQDSVKLDADDVRVTLEGSVLVSDSASQADPEEAARSLVSVLARLLVAAGPGVPPYLLQLVKESTTGEHPRGLRDLHDAIEASLIPINRGASRRVLARLVRESDRPPAPEAPQLDPHELDAELDELLRDPVSRTLEPRQAAPSPEEPEPSDEPVTERIRIPRGVATAATEEPEPQNESDTATASFRPPVPDSQPDTVPIPASEPALARASAPIPPLEAPPAPAVAPAAAVAAIPEEPSPPRPEPITATIKKWQPQTPPEPTPEPPSASTAETSPETATDLEADLETPTESVFGTGSVSASESIPSPDPSPSRSSLPSGERESVYDRPSLPQQPPKRRGGWGVWLFAAALGLGAYGLIASGTLDAILRPAAPVAVPAPSGTIEVSVTPADAQIFIFVGRGPAVAHEMPVSAAHEFIVFDQGLRPSRAIVPEGASWSSAAAGPLYELAVQAVPAPSPADARELGAPQTTPAEPGAEPSGSIRIITNPPGAKVYRFVGSGPAARIPVASIHEGQEVLVYHPAHEIRRVVVGPSDWQAAEGQGARAASVAVDLPPLPSSEPTEPVED